jgi:hypothetical protein
VLAAIAILSIGLSCVGEMWAEAAFRHKLADLDWIGQQFTDAIGAYYQGAPGVVVRAYPRNLDVLVRDDRFVVVRRYLRRVYSNPFTGKPDWVVLAAPGGGICGVGVRIVHDGQPIERRYVFSPAR